MMIYLDYAASTPTLPEVIDAMQPWMTEFYANPASTHQLGLKAAKEIEQAKTLLADKIGCYPSEIIFTSGATESNNLILKGLAKLNTYKGNHIITTAIEHKCILNICKHLETQGFNVTYVKPEPSGIITTESIRKAITDKTILVSVMHVNNELGTINPITEIGALCEEREIAFHSDTAQSFCKLDIDVIDMNLAAISVSAHKIGGPKGCGFAFVRDARASGIEPIIHGAGQQLGLRGGTMPTPLIAGLAAAVKHYKYDRTTLAKIRSEFIRELINKNIEFKINGVNTLESFINITFSNDSIVAKLNSNINFCISNGSACNSKNIEPSHVLTTLGLNPGQARKTARITFSNENLLQLINYLP